MSKASLFAGIFSLLVCISVWTIIALYLTEHELNPIQDALDEFFPKLEEFLLLQKNAAIQEGKFNETDENLRNYVEEIKVFCPSLITATLVISVVYACSTIMMMIGTQFQLSQGLMIPYIFLQLFFIIIMIYNSIFMNLTLVLMTSHTPFLTAPKSHAHSLVSFILFILISLSVLASMTPLYQLKIKWHEMIWMILGYMLVVYFALPSLPINFSEAYYGNILTALASLHAIFAMCLFQVSKDFTWNKIEPQDVR